MLVTSNTDARARTRRIWPYRQPAATLGHLLEVSNRYLVHKRGISRDLLLSKLNCNIRRSIRRVMFVSKIAKFHKHLEKTSRVLNNVFFLTNYARLPGVINCMGEVVCQDFGDVDIWQNIFSIKTECGIVVLCRNGAHQPTSRFSAVTAVKWWSAALLILPIAALEDASRLVFDALYHISKCVC